MNWLDKQLFGRNTASGTPGRQRQRISGGSGRVTGGGSYFSFHRLQTVFIFMTNLRSAILAAHLASTKSTDQEVFMFSDTKMLLLCSDFANPRQSLALENKKKRERVPNSDSMPHSYYLEQGLLHVSNRAHWFMCAFTNGSGKCVCLCCVPVKATLRHREVLARLNSEARDW